MNIFKTVILKKKQDCHSMYWNKLQSPGHGLFTIATGQKKKEVSVMLLPKWSELGMMEEFVKEEWWFLTKIYYNNKNLILHYPLESVCWQ